MTGSILVSVTVLTYNSSEYVLETLESVKNQTYEKLELIISDDNSKDSTKEICENWLLSNQDRFTRIEFVKSSVNTGISANKNRAMRACTGEWVKSIAGDDLLYPHCVEYNVKLLECLPDDCRIINTEKTIFKIDNGKKKILETEGRAGRREIFFNKCLNAKDQLKLAVNYIRPSANGHFINLAMYWDIGGCDETYPMHEDRPLLIRILSNGYRLYGTDEKTVMYRVHDKSIYNKGGELIYSNWFYESEIPVIKDYYFRYMSLMEKSFYNYYFSVTKVVRYCFNKRILFNRLINKVLVLPFELFKKYRQHQVVQRTLRKKC